MKIILAFLVFIISFGSVYACKPGEIIPGVAQEVIVVFCASEFQGAIQEIKKEFEAGNPEVQLYICMRGSRELGYVIREAKLVPRVDVIISSSPEVIENFLFPDYLDWYVIFGRDELCLAFTENSRYANQINQDNWHEIISQNGVKIARADENLDSLGYRTLLCWRLADSYYNDNVSERLFKNCPTDSIYPKEEEVILSIKSGDVDYAFEYLGKAQRNSLRYVKLPPQINLGDPRFLALYEKVSVSVSGEDRNRFIELKGKPINFALGFLKGSISKGRPKKFFKFLFSEQARDIFKKNGLELNLINCQGNIPEEFKELCSPKE